MRLTHIGRTNVYTAGATRAKRLLVMALAAMFMPQLAGAQDVRADAMVRRALEEGRELPVIVRFSDDAAADRGQRMLEGASQTPRHRHRHLKGLGGRVAARTLRSLLQDPGTAWVSFDAPVTGSQVSGGTVPGSVDASGARVARERFEVTGSGVRVAVIDSGLQPHRDLPRRRIAAFVDFVNGRTEPYDDYGHGTHVAGIIAGSGVSSDGRFTGVAPGADIVALKVLDGTGAGTTSDVLEALEWVLDNARAYNIRVVNLSLGHPVFESAATDPMVALVEALTRQGLVVVTSAGNMGTNTATGEPVYQSVTSPGNAPSAVTVGAAHTHGSLSRADDTVATFSSHGPTAFEHEIKPDLVAPGYAIASLDARGSYLQSTYPQLQVMPGYLRLSGTSMAAPVVAGAAALMLAENPGLSSHTVKAVMQFTAQQLPEVDVLSQGAGALNVVGAVRLAARINPNRSVGREWLRGRELPEPSDVLFGETVNWSKQTFWGDDVLVGDWAYVHHPMFGDDTPWSQNIVWSTGSNIVWSTGSNIVWSTGNNIVWSTGSNIVWSTGSNIVWSTGSNIVWSTGNNIVWSTGSNIVWSTGNNIVWSTAAEAVLTGEAW